MKNIRIEPTISKTGPCVSGFTKFGTTPSGGIPAGVIASCSAVKLAKGFDMLNNKYARRKKRFFFFLTLGDNGGEIKFEVLHIFKVI